MGLKGYECIKFAIILILFLLTYSCKTKNEEISIEKKIDTLLYSYKGHHDFKKLMLFSNNTFKFINQDHYKLGFTKSIGDFYKEGSSIILKPSVIEECKYKNVNDTVRPICNTLKYSESKFKVKTNYIIIDWKNNSYLLSEEPDLISTVGNDKNDFHRFIEYYNENLEPNKHGRYLVSKNKEPGSVKLRIKDFPEKYRNLIHLK